MSSKRRFQIFAQAETQPGVTISDASLFVAANAKLQPKDPVLTITVDQYQREITRASLAALTSISGKVECELTFAVEASGSSSLGLPVWSTLLEACGLRKQAINVAPINATFAGTSGQKVIEHLSVAAGNTESVIVIGDTWEGQSRIRYYIPTGSDDFESAETVTVTLPSTQTVTCTTSNVGAAGGYSWFPVSANQLALDVNSVTGGGPASGDLLQGATSKAIVIARQAISGLTAAAAFELLDGTINVSAGETLTNLTQSGKDVVIAAGATVSQTRIPTLTLGLIEDGVAKKMTGARGTVSMSGDIGKPVFFNFSFKGTLASVSDRAPVTGVTYDSQVPPKFMGAQVKVGSQVSASYPGYNSFATMHTPRITSFMLDLGAQVSVQQDASQTNGTTVAYHTNTRQGKGSINPEVRPEAAFPLVTLLQNGTTFRLNVGWGTVNGNRFLLSVPSCKPTSDGSGDRDGFATRDYGFDVSGLDVNFAEREDCDFVLTYSLSGSF